MVSTLEQMQVPNGTGPGVRRSKRPLLASRTRCNVPWKPPKFGNKVKVGIKVQFGNKFANRCNVLSIEGVKKRYQNFDYTTIADRHRTVSWSNSSHPTGVVKPVNERSTFPLTASAV